jgi:hypothetical protein
VTISTAILLYTLSIIAGVVFVVYGLSIRPQKREESLGSLSLDAPTDPSVPLDDSSTFHKDNSSE